MSRTIVSRIKRLALALGVFIPLVTPAPPVSAEPAPVREIEIVVDGGYQPSRVTVKAGERVRLKFVRKEYTGCTRELVIPALELRKELPPHKAVFVELPALGPGDYEFRCGMNMVRGAITILPS